VKRSFDAVACAQTKHMQVVLSERWSRVFASVAGLGLLDAPGLGRHIGREDLDLLDLDPA
jgi:hypothetical protein